MAGLCGLCHFAPASAASWVTYTRSHVDRTIACNGQPVLLAGNHTTIRLSNDCRQVRVAGEHNDIFVRIVPGGRIEITGIHNDVTWALDEPGRRPTLVRTAARNTFHPAR